MKTTKFQALKDRIKVLAIEGREQRDAARNTFGLERHEFKQRANYIGVDARHHLLAYTLLRGKRLEDCESPNTLEAPGRGYVLSLVRDFYVPIEGRDQDEFMEQAKTQLDQWITVCDRNFLNRCVREYTQQEAA